MGALLMLAVAMQAQAAAPTATSPDQLVAKMQRFYDQTRDFKADFEQTLSSAVFGRKQVSRGTVRLKKPGKMRWDYVSPEKKLFVSDGKVLWVYEPEDNQAFRQLLAESALPTAVTFLFGKGDLTREFDVRAVSPDKSYDPGDEVVELLPKKPTAHYKRIVLELDPRSHQVKQSFIFDTQGNVNQVRFTKVELNTKMADSVFLWSPPAGTKVVKPGQLGTE